MGEPFNIHQAAVDVGGNTVPRSGDGGRGRVRPRLMPAALDSWNDGAAKTAIVDFVETVTQEGGPGYVPPSRRVAVFDNDGTLWCEKPMPIELGFILKRFVEMADADATLRDRQPWKAACEHDYRWLGEALTRHYDGDDSQVKVLMGALLQAFAGQTVEEYSAAAAAFLRNEQHPTLARSFLHCAYQPMIDLLRYLESNGFMNYIASGGDRDFMRPVTAEVYGIPAERVIGSSNALSYTDDEHGGAVSYQATPDVFDDGPTKPVRIWSRIGQRPILAGGNSNGDIPMLRYTGGKRVPALRLLLLHDDEEREFAYTTGADESLRRAAEHGWTVVSMRNDWTTVFAG
jgi:phosphoglycolate phosphatase-like HAD superfamily hydrolase